MLVGTVGTDGGSYCALLEERGIDTTHVERRSDSVTATAIIGTDSHERQVAFFHPGADALGFWPSAQLSEERDNIAWAVVGPRNPVIMMQAVRWCADVGIPLLFDPGQLIIGLSPDELRFAITRSRGVICNSYEWSLLRERTGWDSAEVLQHAAFLIVTQGEEGVELYEKAKGQPFDRAQDKQGKRTTIAACKPDQVVNPTGAGDAFRAGLLLGLGKKWSLTESCRLGAVMGSKVVEIEGTQLDTLDKEEVWERVRMTHGKELPT